MLSNPRHLSWLVLLALLPELLTGCISSPSPQPTPLTVSPPIAGPQTPTSNVEPVTPTIQLAVTKGPSSTSTASSAPLPTSTPTILRLSPSATATSVPTIPADVRLRVQCLTIAKSLPIDAKLNGIIALFDPQSFESSLLNLATGQLQSLDTQTEHWRDLVVSNDGTRMAATRVQFDKPGGRQIANQLVVMAADGKVLKAIPLPDSYWILGPAWLDDQRLLVQLAALDPAESADLKAASLLVINPFTGEQRTLRPNYPDIYNQPYVYDWFGWGETAYDPSLTRVVYPRNPTPQGIPYVLWDVQKHTALATFYDVGGANPRWSPDGTQFAITSPLVGKQTGPELYLIDREGRQITPLTNLSVYLGGRDEIGDLMWSPDGHHLAFWLRTDLTKVAPEHLAILDATTGQVTDYCIPGSSDTYRPTDSHDVSIVWSPNSEQLAVRYQPDDQTSITTLVDPMRGYAAKISDHLEPTGWLATP